MRTSKCRVLLVEDDSLIAFDAGAMIQQELDVEVHGHRFDALALARLFCKLPPDLMLIDLCPWQEDRLEVVRQAAACGIKVVIGTVFDEARNGLAGLMEIPVLVKPYDPAKLVEVVKRELAALHVLCGPIGQMRAS